MRKHIATILGFLIAPLFAATALATIEVVKGALDYLSIQTFDLVFIHYCFTIIVTLIIALPVYLLLNHYKMVKWWSALLAGVFSGAVMIFFYDLNPLVVVIGGVSGIVFWLIWRQGREK